MAELRWKTLCAHYNLRNKEEEYTFRGIDILVDDFWDYVKKEGFII
jgi:hypothetical protein